MKLYKLMLVGLFFLLVAADQISKWWVVEMYFRPRNFNAGGATADFWPWLTTTGQERMGPFHIEITSYFDLVMAWNKGVSFSMFSSESAMGLYLLSGIALIMSCAFTIWFIKTPSRMTALPLAMIVAGALSNVWDRVRFGAVADFLYFHIGSLGWPAFNVADSCIVTGVALLAFDSLFLEPKRARERMLERTLSDVSAQNIGQTS